VLVDAIKVIQALLLPPGLLLLLVVLAVALAAAGKKRLALVLTCAGCSLVFLMSISPVSDLLLRPVEGRYPPLDPAAETAFHAEAVVLLGGGLTPEGVGKSRGAALSQSAMRRTVYAARLARRLGLPVIASGGRVVPDPAREAEAAVAARMLEELGVPPKMILQEAESRTTWENALRIRDTYGPRRVLLVTSASHMPRAVACFQRLGIAVLPAPTDYLSKGSAYFLDWLPAADALEGSLTALREYVGIVAYRALYGGPAAGSAARP
jgi:uncharacterized SAM-binding protein YcdF (DUF218 family)